MDIQTAQNKPVKATVSVFVYVYCPACDNQLEECVYHSSDFEGGKIVECGGCGVKVQFPMNPFRKSNRS